MNNSIPGDFPNTRDDEGEFEAADGTISPVYSDLSLPVGEDYNDDEVNNMEGNDEAMKNANGLMSRLDQNLNLGRVIQNMGRGGSSTAATASNPQQKPKASGTRGTRKGPARKRKTTEREDPAAFVPLAYRELKRDEYIWPRPTKDRMPARKCRK